MGRPARADFYPRQLSLVSAMITYDGFSDLSPVTPKLLCYLSQPRFAREDREGARSSSFYITALSISTIT